MKVSILTLGCKVNQTESAVIEGNLRHYGVEIVDLNNHPDYCVINTCTVTAKSDYQSRQLIRRALRTGAKVIVTGCYSQVRSEEIKKIDGSVDIIDNDNKYIIINKIINKIASNNLSFNHRARPYIKVQDGCNNACTYCIVPRARGKSRSMPVSDILEQALEFERQGYREIVLTGIHLGLYGYDLKPKLKLSHIIQTILNKTSYLRIRLSSLEVNEIDASLIDLFQEKRVCRHLHIPLQSGDDNVLKEMNRKYTSTEYLRVMESIMRLHPDIAFGTDVIVGFPGEGEREFRNTIRILDLFPLSYMHIFPFSPRPGTAAAEMRLQNSVSVKKERIAILNVLHIRKRQAYLNSQIGESLDVIVEDQVSENTVVGTSSNYLKILVQENTYPKKTLIQVKVAGTKGNQLQGTPINIR
jgi:threonylcarbamoyladenosine tRNA methylthiotransferase MtaB